MSDLYFLDESPASIGKALTEFENRSAIILRDIFHKSYDVQMAFRHWFRDLCREQGAPSLILHEESLYISAQYLGIDAKTVETGHWNQEYINLSSRNNW